jgi:hypothetical protein
LFPAVRSTCLHLAGKLNGGVRGRDRDQLMKSVDKAHMMRHKRIAFDGAVIAATGNATQLPSKHAAKKISAQRRHVDRRSTNIVESLRIIANEIHGVHDLHITSNCFSASIYSEQSINLLDKVACLPGGLFGDYTGGLCLPWTDESGTDHTLLHFFLCAPSYQEAAPLALFELVTSDQTGAELYAAMSVFKAACIRVLRRPVEFGRMTFDMAPHILSAFCSFCNAETVQQYRERRWKEARGHLPNGDGKTRNI